MTTNPNHIAAASRRRGFTLVELLVVISIIALLASLIFPITKAVNRNKIRSKARTELGQLEVAIESYKNKTGQYPPDNPNPLYRYLNPLYFELSGTTNNGVIYVTLDKSAQIQTADLPATFGITGFVNTMRDAGSEEGPVARNFLVPGLKPNQIGELPTPAAPSRACIIVSSIRREETKFQLNSLGTLNPFFYNSSNPTNNPNSYDLYLDVMVDGKTNRISNWSKEPLIVSGAE